MADETLVEEARTVALRDATAVRASLELGVGELAIGGGASTLLAADFAYNAPDWRPELSYDEQQGQGELSLVQPTRERRHGKSNARNRWDLRFANDVPLDLALKLGSVEGTLALGALALSALRLEVGTGNLTLDLTETRARDLHIPIKGGVLNLKLIVPSTSGVQVEVRSPVSNVHAKGWQRARHIWVNDAYGTMPETMRISIDSGVASITLAQQVPTAGARPASLMLH